MKIFFISDTHGFHDKLVIPKCDMIIHCGDFSNYREPSLNILEAETFLNWYNSLDIEYKLLTCGNHDTSIYSGLVDIRDWKSINLFLHESKKIAGINIFGSPYTPVFGDWVYMYKRQRGDTFWKVIPEKTDIVFTHGPGKGTMDLAYDYIGNKSNIVQVGCKALANRISKVKPKIHAFGHIHSEDSLKNNGVFVNCGINYINCSSLSHKENVLYPGYIIDFERV